MGIRTDSQLWGSEQYRGLCVEMASAAEEGSSPGPEHHEATECSSGPAFQEAQKWIEVRQFSGFPSGSFLLGNFAISAPLYPF